MEKWLLIGGVIIGVILQLVGLPPLLGMALVASGFCFALPQVGIPALAVVALIAIVQSHENTKMQAVAHEQAKPGEEPAETPSPLRAVIGSVGLALILGIVVIGGVLAWSGVI
jgi:hypothetical protein